VQRLDAVLAAVAHAQPPRLEVGRVRGRGDLAVPALRREPGLDVVLLARRGPQVAGSDVHDAVRDAQALDELLLDREQQFVLVGRALGQAEDEHLDLVELVDPEHAARVLAGCARLAPEAGGVARVVLRQLLHPEDLVHVDAGERHLRGSGEVQPVAFDRVDVDLVGGEKPGAVHRLLADEHGRQDRHEALGGERLDRVAVKSELGQGGGSDAVREPRARDARAPLHVDAGELEVILCPGQLARLADPTELDSVLFGHTVRRRRIGRVRHLCEQLVAARRSSCQ
jgi:hypothetical protein